jgi:hypothetical protein
MTFNWVGALIGMVVCGILAYFIPALLPSPLSTLVYVLLVVIAVVCLILLIVALLRMFTGRL